MNRKRKMYTTNKSVNDIFSLFKRCLYQLLNVTMENTTQLWKKQQNKLGAIPIISKFTKAVITSSMNYHKVDLDLSLTDLDLLNLYTSNTRNYLLLLPEWYKDGYINVESISAYYIIDSEWNELDNMNNLYIPKSPECKYYI